MAFWYRFHPAAHSRRLAFSLLASLSFVLAPALAHAQAMAREAPGDSAHAEAPALAPIIVEADRAGPSATAGLGGFSSAPLEATPLAIDVISATELLDRGVNSLSAAIRTDPSVGDNYNTFGYVEALQVRGFALNELLNYQRDGMTVSSHVPIALENKERIEILKGASGMLAGSSAPGGLVNYVLKQPTAAPLMQFDSTISERGSALVHGDFGGHFGPEGALGYRINLAAEERRPEVDHAWSKRTLISGFFDWHATAGTLVQVEFEHQKARETSVPGYALLDSTNSGVATTLPAPIAPQINLNAQPWTQPFESTATSASLRLEQQLAAGWELSLRAATQRSATNDRIAFPDGCSYVNAGLNSNQPPAYYYLANGLCSNYNVDIYQYISDDEIRNTNGTDAHVHGRVGIAGTEHELTVGIKTTRYSERYPPLQTYNFVGTESVFAPVALPANPAPSNPNANLDTDLDEIYAFEVAHFAQRWSSWLGARYTRITEDSALIPSNAVTGGLESTRLQQHLVTPWVGLGHAPWTGGFAYASLGSGVEVASVPNRPAFLNPGQALPAQRSRQAELGFKQHTGLWSFDLALFRITKPFTDNLVTPGGLLQVAGARAERHQGLELAGAWQALASLQLRASATLIDAKTTEAVNTGWVGKAASNVAPLGASLQESWSPACAAGLSWSNLWTYAGHKTVLPDGSVDLPNYWQWDTSVRYAVDTGRQRWVWRAGIDNLTARSYWREAPTASWGSTYLFPAQARSARLGVSISW